MPQNFTFDFGERDEIGVDRFDLIGADRKGIDHNSYGNCPEKKRYTFGFALIQILNSPNDQEPLRDESYWSIIYSAIAWILSGDYSIPLFILGYRCHYDAFSSRLVAFSHVTFVVWTCSSITLIIRGLDNSSGSEPSVTVTL
jgi:hypothetical protein